MYYEPAHPHRLHRPGRGNPLHNQWNSRDHTLSRDKGILEGMAMANGGAGLTGTALLLSRALENMRRHYRKARTCWCKARYAPASTIRME